MTIHIPQACRGLSAGAMRQLRESGRSSTHGVVTSSCAEAMVQGIRISDLMKPSEKLGKYMAHTDEITKQLSDTTNAIALQLRTLNQAAAEGTKEMLIISGKMRDSTQKFSEVMTRFTAVASSTKFAETAKVAESLVSSLERLAVLQESGKLDKVLAALNGTK